MTHVSSLPTAGIVRENCSSIISVEPDFLFPRVFVINFTSVIPVTYVIRRMQ